MGFVCIVSQKKEKKYTMWISIPFTHTSTKQKRIQLGHPQILVNPVDQDTGNYFGIAKVKILLPPLLYHPVLPVHIGGKLIFPLCGNCVKEQLEKPLLIRTADCNHTEEERCITGT